MEEYDEEEEYYESSEPNMKLSHAFVVVLILHLIAVAGIFGFNAMKSRQASLERIAKETAASISSGEALPVAELAAAAGATVQQAVPSAPTTAEARVAPTTSTAKSHQVVPGDTLTKISSLYGVTIESIEAANNMTPESILRVGQVLVIPSAAAAAAPTVAKQAPTTPSKVAASPAPAPASSVSSAPALATSSPRQEVAGQAATSQPSVASGDVYEVVAGDNPYSIAKRLKVGYQELLELNGITDPTKLQIGQKLKVPASR